jgi:hypothetical protein
MAWAAACGWPADRDAFGLADVQYRGGARHRQSLADVASGAVELLSKDQAQQLIPRR